MNLTKISSIVILLVFSLCCTRKRAMNDFDSSGPPTMIYIMKEESYKVLVPVMLSADRSEIIAYPAKQDLFKNNRYTYPTELTKGYFLDNRGINAQTALLKLNYEMYLKLEDGFSSKDLFFQIRDKNPFIELYDCGNRFKFKDEVKEINQMILKNKLKNCKCLIKQ
ncbi:MAG: hypothetical protein IPN15_09735 [Saprospiraceae bacterium]|nr:hypothetical protein [Candidatus Vicinibacter affinis]MBK8642470.1 hypothetical protein [Candidatus Vicinibacter affinis]